MALAFFVSASILVGGCADSGSSTESVETDNSSSADSDAGNMMADAGGISTSTDPADFGTAMPPDDSGSGTPSDDPGIDPATGLPFAGYTDSGTPSDDPGIDPATGLPFAGYTDSGTPPGDTGIDPATGLPFAGYTDSGTPSDDPGIDPATGLPIAGTAGDPGAGTSPEGFTDAPGTGTTPEGFPSSPDGDFGPDGGVGGDSRPQAPPEGSPEFPAFQLVLGLKSGNLKDMGKYISSRARGDLFKIRTGKLSDDEKAAFKKTFERPELTTKPRSKSGGRLISLKSGEQFIAILVKKEGGKWKVSEMTIRTPTKR
jgi:hypothetical protein